MTRQVFFSFHYEKDSWRVGQVRGIGVVEGNEQVKTNKWEAIARRGDRHIQAWIKEQMRNRTCAVVLVGTCTAYRRWVRYEICQAWNRGMGVVGIRIHGLKNKNGKCSYPGENPFSFLELGEKRFSSIVECYNPPGKDSTQRYNWIKKNLTSKVEEAIRIREDYK